MFINHLKSKKVPLGSAILAVVLALSSFAFYGKAQGVPGFSDTGREGVVLRMLDYLQGTVSEASPSEFVSDTFGAVGTLLAENYLPYVRYNAGYYSAKDVTTTGTLTGGTLTVTGVTSLVGQASTTADLIVSGGTFDMTTTTATTTSGIFIRTRPATKATTTLSIGDSLGDNLVGCIEMIRGDGSYARAIIDGTSWNIKDGRCND